MTEEIYIGIEGGGSHTIAMASSADGHFLERKEFGPGNVRLLSDSELRSLFKEIAAALPRPDAIGAGIAGAREQSDFDRIDRAITEAWGAVPRSITNDLEIALATLAEDQPKILVLSGTGSCCFGRAIDGRTIKVGGWGHVLGDKGSGYEIGLRALKAVVYYLDRDGKWSPLGQRILRRLMLNQPNDLIAFAQNAHKSEIAALAIEVFAAAAGGDPIARDILDGAASSLARDAIACANRLRVKKTACFLLAGSVLTKQKKFAKEIAKQIRSKFPEAEVRVLEKEAVWGAVKLAEKALPPPAKARPGPAAAKHAPVSIYLPSFDPRTAPTEMRNPRSKNLDKLTFAKGVELMFHEEGAGIAALHAESKKVARAAELAFQALDSGGRVFYVGAGTSGRLGILDASECPPTFRAPPEMIQGIIAGGEKAIWQSAEGAEDDAKAGADAIAFRGITSRDLVIGIAASGRTPFVWGAFAEAKNRGTRTVLICFNPGLKIDREHRPDLVIAPKIGPEVLTGSTRLKSGTATKLILNAISTLTMVKLGKVASNLMIDLNPSNLKLRDRAVRIVQEITGVDPRIAEDTLEKNGWVIKQTLDVLKRSKGEMAKPRKTR